mmetsp:Transcript_35078/g.99466  ORF Transcript_35078/g.99466 Transcript_35078/m.99466 type:complete len:256 (-) Transcript_35078:2917-3684(-)
MQPGRQRKRLVQLFQQPAGSCEGQEAKATALDGGKAKALLLLCHPLVVPLPRDADVVVALQQLTRRGAHQAAAGDVQGGEDLQAGEHRNADVRDIVAERQLKLLEKLAGLAEVDEPLVSDAVAVADVEGGECRAAAAHHPQALVTEGPASAEVEALQGGQAVTHSERAYADVRQRRAVRQRQLPQHLQAALRHGALQTSVVQVVPAVKGQVGEIVEGRDAAGGDSVQGVAAAEGELPEGGGEGGQHGGEPRPGQT